MDLQKELSECNLKCRFFLYFAYDQDVNFFLKMQLKLRPFLYKIERFKQKYTYILGGVGWFRVLLWSSYLMLLSAGLTGVHHHVRLKYIFLIRMSGALTVNCHYSFELKASQRLFFFWLPFWTASLSPSTPGMNSWRSESQAAHLQAHSGATKTIGLVWFLCIAPTQPPITTWNIV
jgi:hypothetical protein